MKDQGLIRNHFQFDGDAVCGYRDLQSSFVRRLGRFAAIATARDEQKRRLRCGLVWLDDADPMLPHGAVDIFFGAPCL
jgi:hypothetical protein